MIDTASVIWLPSRPCWTGIGVFSMRAVQPGTGRTLTVWMGFSLGNCTRTLVVAWLGRSFGTRKAIVAYSPFAATEGSMVTWANAGTAVVSTATATTATVATTRRLRLM